VNRKEYVDWAVKVLTVVRSVWSTFSGEGASEWRESVHKEFIKTGITPKDYLDFVCSILHISRKVKIILLDGTVQEAKILDFLDMSYDLTDGRIEESIESGHPVCYCWCSRNVWWRCSRMENYRIYLLYLKTIKSSCEESCIKAKYIFNKVVKFIFHGSLSPFVFLWLLP